MTVQDVANFVDHVGNGIATSFPFVFRADDVSWVTVDFTTDIIGVTLNADQDAAPGGTVDYSVAPPDLQAIRIQRVTPQAQDLDYTRYDPFDSESHEDALDKLTMEVQDLEQVSASGVAFLQAQIDAIVLGATGRFQDLTDVDDLHDLMFIGPVINFNAQAMNDFAILNQSIGSVAGVAVIDYKLGMGVTLTLTENVTTLTLSNIPATNLAQIELDIRQDSVARTIAWPAAILWPGDTEPDITTVDSITQVHLRTTDGGTTWLGSYVENES